MKQNLTRIIVCLLPVLLSLGIVGWAYAQYLDHGGGFRLGVDLVGGTILVYEVDESKGFKGDYNAEDLAARLKRRIDPADLYNVTVRPVKGSPPRVEVILPILSRYQEQQEEKAWESLLVALKDKGFTDKKEKDYADITRGDLTELRRRATEDREEDDRKAIEGLIKEKYGPYIDRRGLSSEQIEQIKELIARQGALEFRILANQEDDKDALQAAQDFLKNAQKERKFRDFLRQRAEENLPPPVVANFNKKGDVEPDDHFQAKCALDGKTYRYSWIEIGKEELYSLHLNGAIGDNKESPYHSGWQSLAKVRFDPDKIDGDEFAFGAVSCPGTNLALVASRKIPAGAPNRNKKDIQDGKKYEYFLLTRESQPGKEVTGDYLVSASKSYDQRGRLAVAFRFDATGGNLFYDVTQLNRPSSGGGGFQRHLAIILDGQIRSAPVLQSPISTSGQITGEFSQADVDTLVRILRAGALPATLRPDPVSQNTMGATLGEDTIRSGTFAIGWSFVAVLVFMVVYYRFAGGVACIALFANLLLTVAFMVLVSAAFTLPGLAGLVLTLGMAVDANVLIYERLREERERGASLAMALRNGYDRAFPTIIDTHLSSIFTAIVLYVVGNDQLKGFGISLTVGLIISLFTSLYMTRTLFDVGLAAGWVKELSFLHLFHKPNFNFMAIRYYLFTITGVLTVLGALLFLFRLDKGGLNIDFVGGTAYSGVLTEKMTITELRKKLEGVKLEEISIEQIYLGDPEFSDSTGSRLFTVRTTEKKVDAVQDAIVDALGDKLEKVLLTKFEVSDPRNATFTFSDFASPAQMSLLLGRILPDEFKENSVKFQLRGEGKSKEGRYKEMKLLLGRPATSNAEEAQKLLEKAVKRSQDELGRRPQPERLENFDSQLAASTQQRALYAIIASWIAILLYLWFRFGNWTFGLAAVLCLIHDLFFTLGVLAGTHYVYHALGPVFLIQDFKIDLPCVASLLTLVGYSVNDTIVVFDRIREVRGKNPHLTAQMINDSINQTLSRTVLASLTVFLVVVVLYIAGGEGVHLFSFVMVIGVLVGTYSSIYVASPLLLIFGEGAGAPEPRPVERPAEKTEVRKEN